MTDGTVLLLPRWTQQSWMDDAACRGRTQLFFAPKAERPQARARREVRARELCMSCPAQLECRTFARDNREYGLWGGESEDERSLAGYSIPAVIGLRARRAEAS